MDIYDIIREVLKGKKDIIFLELGSNDCQTTKFICDILKDVAISFEYHCFEVVPEMVTWSREQMKDYPQVHIHNLAIADKTENQREFYLSVNKAYNGSSSLKQPRQVVQIWKDLEFKTAYCNTITIDDFCGIVGINHIDFIWSDIQGAEELMIKGSEKMLSEIDYLYTEYNENLYDGSLDVSDISKLLPNFAIIEDYGGDVLFKNNAYKMNIETYDYIEVQPKYDVTNVNKPF
jgi:FkbM family methyltransferase